MALDVDGLRQGERPGELAVSALDAVILLARRGAGRALAPQEQLPVLDVNVRRRRARARAAPP